MTRSALESCHHSWIHHARPHLCSVYLHTQTHIHCPKMGGGKYFMATLLCFGSFFAFRIVCRWRNGCERTDGGNYY